MWSSSAKFGCRGTFPRLGLYLPIKVIDVVYKMCCAVARAVWCLLESHIYRLFKHILSNIEMTINNDDNKLLPENTIKTI